MIRTMRGNVTGAVGQLPGNEDAALSTYVHSGKTLIEAGNQAPEALRKDEWLERGKLRLAIGSRHRLAIFHHRCPVFV